MELLHIEEDFFFKFSGLQWNEKKKHNWKWSIWISGAGPRLWIYLCMFHQIYKMFVFVYVNVMCFFKALKCL